jgi:hypothetical protein
LTTQNSRENIPANYDGEKIEMEETSMSLEAFERCISMLSFFCLVVSPIQIAAASIFLFDDRIAFGLSGVIAGCTGLIPKRAVSRFREAPLAGVILVEKVFYYLVIPTALFGFVYRCLTNDIDLDSSAGIMFVAFNAFLSVAVLYVVRALINNAKLLAGSQ